MIGLLGKLARRATAGVVAGDTHAPLLAPDEIAALAAQAELLAELPRQREVHDHHAGDWPSAVLGRGLDFEESRPYQRGDDIRDMDWRTTARTGRAYLKICREERQPVLHVVVDRGPGMRFGTRRRLKAAQAARLAALAAFTAAARNAAVGGTLWDVEDLSLPPLHGRAGALALIQAAAAPCPPLAVHEAAEAVHELDRLARLEAELPRGTRLLLLTDFAWLAEAHEPLLARLAERLDVLALQVLDPAERALPDVGLACFQNIAGGARIWLDTGRAALRRAVDAGLKARQEAIADRLARAGIAHRVVPGEADDLMPYLGVHA